MSYSRLSITEADVHILEGESARVCFVFQTREGQLKTEEVVTIVERLLIRNGLKVQNDGIILKDKHS